MIPAQSSGVIPGMAGGAVTGASFMILGAHADAIMAGLFAGIMVSLWLPTIDDRKKSFAAIVLTAVVAGYASPIAADWLAATQEGFQHTQALRMLIALVIGIACPFLVPAALEGGRKKLEGGRNE